MSQIDTVITAKVAAKTLGLTPGHIQRLADMGKMKGEKIRGQWVFDPSEVNRYADNYQRSKAKLGEAEALMSLLRRLRMHLTTKKLAEILNLDWRTVEDAISGYSAPHLFFDCLANTSETVRIICLALMKRLYPKQVVRLEVNDTKTAVTLNCKLAFGKGFTTAIELKKGDTPVMSMIGLFLDKFEAYKNLADLASSDDDTDELPDGDVS